MFYERLLEKLRENRKEIETLILQGNIEDFESYRYLTGKLKGIQDSIEICIDTYGGYNE